MFKIFKNDKVPARALDFVQNQNKEDLEDFILILKQIQEANNQKTKGPGSFMKDSKQRQTTINNIVTLAIEKTEQKIERFS